MFIKSLLILCFVLPLLSCSGDSTQPENDGDSTQSQNSGGSTQVESGVVSSGFEAVCSEDPFDGRTQGVYTGLFVDEYALSRCEFDVRISIESAAGQNQRCSQTGTLSYTGTQTLVHPTEPRECGTIDEQVVFLWQPSNIDQESDEVVSENLEYPIRLLVGFEESPPTVSVSGNQLEQLMNLGWTMFDQNGNISFVAPDRPEVVYAEFVRL